MNVRSPLFAALVGYLLTFLAAAALLSAVLLGPSSLPWTVPLFTIALSAAVTFQLIARRRIRSSLALTSSIPADRSHVVVEYAQIRKRAIRNTLLGASVFGLFALASLALELYLPSFREAGVVITCFYLCVVAALLWSLRVRLGHLKLLRNSELASDTPPARS